MSFKSRKEQKIENGTYEREGKVTVISLASGHRSKNTWYSRRSSFTFLFLTLFMNRTIGGTVLSDP
jgi:hypothetical protein